MEFKIGDKVICKPGFTNDLVAKGGGGIDYKEGKIGVLSYQPPLNARWSRPSGVFLIGFSNFFNKDALELYKEETETKEKTETLLEKASRLYPIGTKYLPLYYNQHPWGESGAGWGEAREKPVRTGGSSQLGETPTGIHVGIGYIYLKGKWAEIIKEVDKPKEDSIEKNHLTDYGILKEARSKILKEATSLTELNRAVEAACKEVKAEWAAGEETYYNSQYTINTQEPKETEGCRFDIMPGYIPQLVSPLLDADLRLPSSQETLVEKSISNNKEIRIPSPKAKKWF